MNDHVNGTMAGVLNSFGPKENAPPSVPVQAVVGGAAEVRSMIARHTEESARTHEAGTFGPRLACRQVRELIGLATALEVERNGLRAALRDAVLCSVGKVDPDTIESWKRALRLPPGSSIHDMPYTANVGVRRT